MSEPSQKFVCVLLECDCDFATAYLISPDSEMIPKLERLKGFISGTVNDENLEDVYAEIYEALKLLEPTPLPITDKEIVAIYSITYLC